MHNIDQSIILSTNQSNYQPINQSDYQPINHTVNQLIILSTNQSYCQPINQTINQSIILSKRHVSSINNSIDEWMNISISQPIIQLIIHITKSHQDLCTSALVPSPLGSLAAASRTRVKMVTNGGRFEISRECSRALFRFVSLVNTP